MTASPTIQNRLEVRGNKLKRLQALLVIFFSFVSLSSEATLVRELYQSQGEFPCLWVLQSNFLDSRSAFSLQYLRGYTHTIDSTHTHTHLLPAAADQVVLQICSEFYCRLVTDLYFHTAVLSENKSTCQLYSICSPKISL